MKNLKESSDDKIELLSYELETTIQSFNTVIELLGELISFKSIDELFHGILNIFGNYFQIEKSLFAVRSGDIFSVVASHGFEKEISFNKSIRKPDSAAWCVNDLGSSLIVSDIMSDIRFDNYEFFEIKKPFSLISICLCDSSVYGVFQFYFDPIEISVLRGICGRLERLISIFEPHFFNRLRVIDVEEVKNKMQQQIFHASKLATIGTLAAGVAHEINNPLAIMSGYVDILSEFLKKKNISASQTEDALDWQRKSIKRIHDIVNGLRDFARQDTDNIDQIDVHKIIKENLSIVKIIYEKEDIEFLIDLNAENPVASGNVGKLQQVIMNLFSNSRDAINLKGNGTITVQTYNERNSLFVLVKDTGIGIKKENQKKIFDTFFTTKPAGKGTGLGLGISRDIINKMNGNMFMDSKEGIGTTFTIELPVIKQKSPVVETCDDEENDDSIQKYDKLSGKVLLVDDEDAIRKIVKNYLEKFGVSVVESSSGNDALLKLKYESFDYLITDIKMPHMKGGALIEHAKNISPGNPPKIVVISGNIDSELSANDRQALLNLSDGFLKKPFSKKDLYRVLVEVGSLDKK